MYFSNTHTEEFKRLIENLNFDYSDSIQKATFVYIDLEKFIFFDEPNQNFKNHNFHSRDLINRFNLLLQAFLEFERNNPNRKQFRFLNFKIDSVKSYNDEELLRWSFYNHKFTSSKGLDNQALNEWHAIESSLDVNKIAFFKARREHNMALFMHVIKNHHYFNEILVGSLPPRIKNEIHYGLDIAEEKYLNKIIQEQQAQNIVKIVPFSLENPLINLLRQQLAFKQLSFKSHIISNSKKMDQYFLIAIRNIFKHLNIQEVGIDDCDFALLVNDLDAMDLIPLVDTEQPIFVVDLSSPNNPNFSYLLLKDDGFSQLFAYAKKHVKEPEEYTFIRAMQCGIALYLLNRKYNEQIAANYVQDYFEPLAKSLGKTLAEFQGPLDTLSKKLEN